MESSKSYEVQGFIFSPQRHREHRVDGDMCFLNFKALRNIKLFYDLTFFSLLNGLYFLPQRWSEYAVFWAVIFWNSNC